jgi:glycosyltransferase 2 family protein
VGQGEVGVRGPLGRRRKWVKGLTSGLGVVIAVVGGMFVVRALAAEWGILTRHVATMDLRWALAAVALTSVGMLGISLVWWRTLVLLGTPASPQSAVGWYFLGEMGKYVPGGVWAVVGRGEIATKGGVPRLVAYASVLLSLGATYLGAMLVVLALLPLQLGGAARIEWAIWLAVPLATAVAGSHPAVLRRILRGVRRLFTTVPVFEPPPWRASLGLVLGSGPAWVALGLGVWCVAWAMGIQAPPFEMIFAAVLAWVVGFLVVPAPGGLGVREAIFVLAAGSLSGGTAAGIAVLARVLSVLVDAGGGLVVLFVRALGDRRGPHRDDVDARLKPEPRESRESP